MTTARSALRLYAHVGLPSMRDGAPASLNTQGSCTARPQRSAPFARLTARPLAGRTRLWRQFATVDADQPEGRQRGVDAESVSATPSGNVRYLR